MPTRWPIAACVPLLSVNRSATSSSVVLLFAVLPMVGVLVFVFSFYRYLTGVVRFIMESGAQGCEVVVSGKIRGQRAKAMKFCDGLMIHSGDPSNHYIQTAVRHVLLRQGVLGLKVMLCLTFKNER